MCPQIRWAAMARETAGETAATLAGHMHHMGTTHQLVQGSVVARASCNLAPLLWRNGHQYGCVLGEVGEPHVPPNAQYQGLPDLKTGT